MFKVIIADLEPIQREAIKLLLQQRFQRQVIILETDNGQDVVDLVRTKHIDLLILENRLIGLDGLACVKKIKDIKSWQKCIVFTMLDTEAMREAYRSIGVTQILIKPLRPHIFIDEISKVLATNSDMPKKKGNKKIEEIIEFIDSHLNEDLTLTYVAEQMDLSSYYLSKVFKKELGVNFVKYVTERKMEKAKALLKDIEIPIVNIAFEMGFPEPSYFTKVFKKVENMTPTQYRNQHTRWN
ncbi:MAG: helix-turn-helix domain-containing protein [Anaerobacillus sp.]|uniref:helix-turn-helix domain-containing protein n=1 Tax=Anaerobacillus sp. TaxID=1872506 RepID=UPI00391D4B51